MLLRPAGILALTAAPWAVAAGELETLVQGLSDDSFAARESNTAELIRRGQAESDAVRKLVLHHFLKDADPEIRMRCEIILRGLVAESYGFLGVRHRERTYFDEQGKTRRGVELTTVMEGLPAHAAGLKMGDIVMEIDGKTLDVDDPANTFGRAIRLLGAGRQTNVKVDRVGEVLTIPVTTGAAPKELSTIDPETRFQEWLKAQMEETKKAAP